jgi:molybdopterin converting factor small subunit
MMITFYIPGPLRTHSGGQSKVEVSAKGGTLADALAALWQVHPGLRDRVVNEQGQPRQHANIFVGDQNMRDCGGLAAPVKDGDEITIVPNVAGGKG